FESYLWSHSTHRRLAHGLWPRRSSSRIWHRGRYLLRRAVLSPEAMSFFGPISRPLLNEATTPIIRRALQRARMVGNFAFVQAMVQLIGFASGILLVRWL